MIVINSRPLEALRPLIESAWSRISEQYPQITAEEQHAIEETIGLIDRGKVRVAEPVGEDWVTHAWLKQTILLFFRLRFVDQIDCPPFQWTDKIPIKRWTTEMGVRVVPPATVRFGAFVGRGSVLMPSYVNVGAFVDEGTMVDTWATVGSCAQVGKNVHLSGGVGIGGVLEPPQAQPVIIEDNCFVGSRCVVVEGVRVKQGAVLGAGVVLTASTPIVDVRGTEPKVSKGVVPANAVVIPGSYRKKFPAGDFHVPCAMIIGKRKPSTDMKVSLNQTLREFEVPV